MSYYDAPYNVIGDTVIAMQHRILFGKSKIIKLYKHRKPLFIKIYSPHSKNHRIMFTKKDIPAFILLFLALCAIAVLLFVAMYLFAPLIILGICFVPWLVSALKSGGKV